MSKKKPGSEGAASTEPMPQSGGSWLRHPDGSLTRVVEAAPDDGVADEVAASDPPAPVPPSIEVEAN